MQKTAVVISTEGRIATVKSERSAMCDGCHKNSCGNSCAMGAIMGTDKTVTVSALNKVGAEKGDTVEIETSDSKVLIYALTVFILPIVVCAVLYAAGTAFFEGPVMPLIFSVIGFILSFTAIGFLEKIKRDRDPDIVICRIIKKCDGESND